jgi:DNA primase
MTKAAELQVGERTVRVTSPERVIYEPTTRTPAITKLQVCEYFTAVGEPLMRAVGERPTALERWPSGYREGMRLSTGYGDGGDGFYQKRLPKGAPDWVQTAEITFPSGRTAEEMCPTEPAALVWAAQMGTLTLHPWPVRRPDLERPDELRIDLDPQPGTTFADAQRIAAVARELLEELGLGGYPKTNWWKEERGTRVFLDFNQNNRDRTIASAWSLRPKPGAPVSTPMTWAQLADTRDPADFNLLTVPDYLRDGDAWADMDDVSYSLDPLLRLWESLPGGELNFPPDYPKMPGEPPRVQPSRKVAENWE